MKTANFKKRVENYRDDNEAEILELEFQSDHDNIQLAKDEEETTMVIIR